MFPNFSHMKTVKINVSEATNIQLNWLVAVCEGKGPSLYLFKVGKTHHNYTTNPLQMHPIIEREGICFASIREGRKVVRWKAAYAHDGNFAFEAPTTLIAAARCYVTSKLGATVDVPEELA